MDVTVAIDCMGGDHGVRVTVPAAIERSRMDPQCRFILVGLEDAIRAELTGTGVAVGDRFIVRHASEVVTMDEPPATALRGKKDSSMRVAIDLVKSGEAQACA